MSCYCDYDPPEFYVRKTQGAIKKHTCSECGCSIEKGEQYENVRGKWEGQIDTVKTCLDCVHIRTVFSEMKCFCWSHGGLLDDVCNQLSEAEFKPGERFFYLRILASHRKSGSLKSKITEKKTMKEKKDVKAKCNCDGVKSPGQICPWITVASRDCGAPKGHGCEFKVERVA